MASQNSTSDSPFSNDRRYSTATFSLDSAKLPLKIDTSIDAQQLIGSACKLRVEYQEMKVASLQRLQKLLEEVKWINNKLLEVDIHIGQIYHVVDSSGFGIPPPDVARKEHTIIIEGSVHVVQLDADERHGYLSVTLD